MAIAMIAVLGVGALAANNFVVPAVDFDIRDPKCPDGFVYEITNVCIPVPSASGSGGGGGGGGGGDTTAPSVTILSPQNNQELTAGTTSTIVTGIASDNEGVFLVEVAVNDGQFVVASGTNAWSTTIQNLSDGQSYTITVKVRDAAGNVKTASLLFQVKSSTGGGGDLTFVEMRGTNMNTPVLFRNEGSSTTTVSSAFITRMVDGTHDIGLNTWRLNLKMEGWYSNKANFMSHLHDVMEATNNANPRIYVWIDFFQLESGGTGGVGFPNYYFTGYTAGSERQLWWTDFYNDGRLEFCGKVQYCAWDDNFAFMKTVIDATKSYPNLVGYEAINEPELWQTSHYQGLGNYHTYIGQKISAETDKVLIFTRGLPQGGFTQSTSNDVLYVQGPKNVPGEVWFIPHNYRNPTGWSSTAGGTWGALLNGMESLSNYWKGKAGYTNIELAGYGEWAIQNNDFSIGSGLCSMTTAEKQNLFDLATADFLRRGVLHTYYQTGEGKNECVNGATALGVGNNLINPSTGALTEWGQYLKNSIAKYPIVN